MRKIFFKEMHFQFFTTVVLHNKLKLQSEKRIGFSMQKRKAIFVKQHSFVQSSGLHMKMEWDRLKDMQAGHNQNSNTYLSSLKSLYKKAWVRGRGI